MADIRSTSSVVAFKKVKDSGEDSQQSDVSFKNIIFLPFIDIVAYIFLLVNYVSLVIYLYVIGYDTVLGKYQFISSITEVLYAAHTGLLILHRVMRKHSRKRHHKPASMWVMIIDVIVIIPFGNIVTLMDRFAWMRLGFLEKAYHIAYYVKLLRIFRIFMFFKEYRSNLKLNRKIILPLIHFIISTLVGHASGVVYYRIACYNCGYRDWTEILKNFDFNPDNILHWAVICYFCSHTLQLQNASALLENTSYKEYVTATMILLVGLVIQFMYLTGSLISEYIQGMKFKFKFQYRVNSIASIMKIYDVPRPVQKTVENYYQEVWNRRSGLIEMPSIFRLFPPEFQMQINSDIYWEAILHTHVFSVFDNSFKKELSTIMRTEIFLPGQNLYKIGDIKARMIYLVSGILEVMTTENMKSPIMSLSSGTVIGETACIVPAQSSAIVRSATICEMHILDHTELTTLMKKYPHLSTTMKKSWLRRIVFAKQKKDILLKSTERTTHIVWIKTQWRRLLRLSLGEGIDERFIYSSYHTSRFLDLLVLSTRDELKVDSICIKGTCSFIMDPNSGLRRFFHYISLLSIVLQVVGTTHLIAYLGRIPVKAYPMITFLDAIYAMDLYVQAITAVNVHGVLISKPSEVFLHRTKEVYFLVDTLASVPLDYVGLIIGASEYIVALLRTLKFLKVYKIFLFIMEKQNVLSNNVIMYQVLRYICQHSLILVMLVGFVYAASCFNGFCTPTGWLQKSIASDLVHVDPYLKTIYHTTSVYFSMNISQISPGNIKDLMLIYVVYMMGYYMCAFSFVRLCASFALKYEASFLFQLNVDTLESMINDKKELLPYKHAILSYSKHQFIEQNSLTMQDVSIIMGQESQYLKGIMRKDFMKQIIDKTTLFNGCDDDFLDKMANTMRMYAVPENHMVVQPNVRCYYLYIVIKGYCRVRSYAPGDIERGQRWKFIKKYTIFPVVGVLHNVQVFIEVMTETACQLACIPYLDMKKLMMAYPQDANVLRAALRLHKDAHGNLISRKTAMFITTSPPAEALGLVDNFQYKIFQNSVGLEQWSTYVGLAKKKWRRFLHIVIWKTYDPNGNFVLCYESFRSIIVLMIVILLQLSLHPSIIWCFRDKCTLFFDWIEYVFFIDFYIRAHYQYYNELGIKVTHPGWTSKHYITTSFVVDFIACFPINFLQVDVLVFPSNKTLSYITILVLTRVFLLFRPYMLVNYFQETMHVRMVFLCKLVKISIYALFAAAQISCIQLLIVCPITEDYVYTCDTESWMAKAKILYGEGNLLFISFYNIVTLTSIHSFTMYLTKDHIVLLTITSMVFLFKVLYFSEIIGNRVFENSKLSRYQDGISHYLEFTKVKILSDANKTELLEHYKNMWKKSKGEVPSFVFDFLYPLLKQLVCGTMYTPVLMKSIAFVNAERSFFHLLSTSLEERHYKKGADIIRCNDVQGEIFIVYKGSVDVLLANMKLVVLSSGGMFGCFYKTGSTRQTILVRAKVHLCVLCIKTTTFYEIIKSFPSIIHFFNELQSRNEEYILQHQYNSFTSITMSASTNKHDHERSIFSRTINENNKYFVVWNYMASVHVAAISSIFCMFFVVVGKEYNHIYIWILLDMYYSLHIYLKTHARYTDLDSGVMVTDFVQIMKTYAKSSLLYVDILSITPLYIIIWFDDSLKESTGYFLANKLLRILYLWNYYWQHVLRKNVPRHIRWTFVIYLTLFLLQFNFNVWFIWLKMAEQIAYGDVACTYLHVMNIFTNAGANHDIGDGLIVLCLNLVLLTTSHLLFIYLLIIVCRMLLVQNNSTAEYKLKTELFESYCRQVLVSSYIVQKAWEYLIYLYTHQKGEQMPKLLQNAPSYIKQDHMMTLYGVHFERHFIFGNAHLDFLRQLYTHIKIIIYLPNDIIVEAGDVNDTLYFINEGSVVAVEKIGEKHFVENLNEGEWFGEVQGLINVPYDKMYRASTVCSLMQLCKTDWAYLLKWFPATTETLNELASLIMEDEAK